MCDEPGVESGGFDNRRGELNTGKNPVKAGASENGANKNSSAICPLLALVLKPHGGGKRRHAIDHLVGVPIFGLSGETAM